MTEEIKMEVTEMCNLSSMIAEENQLIGEDRGIIVGEERGRIIGEKRGFVKGEDSKSREMSIYLYNHGVPLEIIAGAANATVGQIHKWISEDIQNHKDLS